MYMYVYIYTHICIYIYTYIIPSAVFGTKTCSNYPVVLLIL